LRSVLFYGAPGVGVAGCQASGLFHAAGWAVGSMIVRESPPPSVVIYHISSYSNLIIAASSGQKSWSTISSPLPLRFAEYWPATSMAYPYRDRNAVVLSATII